MPRGGARPGAGRKKTREIYERQVTAAEKKIADKLPGIVDKLIELAMGVKCADYDFEGNPKVYDRAPDRQAAEYLVNRILGKPTEHHEHEFAHLSDEELINQAQEALRGTE